MITQADIEKVANDIAETIHAERIVLFGSYANGHADDNSDVDFLVVAESDQPRYKRSRELYQRIKPHRFPLDIIVYTPTEFNHGSKTPVSFVSQIMREGKIIYVRGT